MSSEHIHFMNGAINWEELLPVVLFLLYGVSQFFGSKKKGEESEEEAADPDAVERARKVREEIQRKIRQRKEAQAGDRSPVEAEREGRPRYDPNVPEHMQQSEPVPTIKELKPEVVVLQNEPRPIIEDALDPVMGGGENLIEKELEKQRQLLESAKREREAALKRAAEMRQRALAQNASDSNRPSVETDRISMGSRPSMRDVLIEQLESPESTRQAILLREVLGPPKALQKGTEL